MKKIYTLLLGIVLTASICFAAPNVDIKKPVQKGSATSVVKSQPSVIYSRPLTILKHSKMYLNKPVYIEGKFDKFSTLGLDYPAAMRPSTDYISFLVQRNDVVDHNIPLSEMKLFLKRDYAEKFIELDTGDKIRIEGKVFSLALGDVWIDVNKIEIVAKEKKIEDK